MKKRGRRRTTPVSELPKQVYVVREVDRNDPDTSYLIVHETLDEIEDGTDVGIYMRGELRRMRVSRTLE